jgi:hypothetical protein
MAQYNCPITLVTPGPDIVFNVASTYGTYYLDPTKCRGLDGPTERAVSEDSPRQSGAYLWDTLSGKWEVVLAGVLLPTNGDDANRNAMDADAYAAIAALRTGDGSVQQTRTGYAMRSLLGIRNEGGYESTGAVLKEFVFSLYTGATDWS